jgi:chromosome segregation ATPase
MRLAPGSTYSLGAQSDAAPALPTPAAPVDERRAKVEAACSRIDQELKQLPETFRQHLGATHETAEALRKAYLELLHKERTLRTEASDESLKFLDDEKAALEARANASTDPSVKKSLGSAMAAIDDQKKQRLALRAHADRLDAELTRLQWTLDGMSTQLVRLRTAGAEAQSAPSGEMMQSVQQLNAEIDAIADALEQVRQSDAAGFEPIAEIAPPGEGTGPSRNRVLD